MGHAGKGLLAVGIILLIVAIVLAICGACTTKWITRKQNRVIGRNDHIIDLGLFQYCYRVEDDCKELKFHNKDSLPFYIRDYRDEWRAVIALIVIGIIACFLTIVLDVGLIAWWMRYELKSTCRQHNCGRFISIVFGTVANICLAIGCVIFFSSVYDKIRDDNPDEFFIQGKFTLGYSPFLCVVSVVVIWIALILFDLGARRFTKGIFTDKSAAPVLYQPANYNPPVAPVAVEDQYSYAAPVYTVQVPQYHQQVQPVLQQPIQLHNVSQGSIQPIIQPQTLQPVLQQPLQLHNVSQGSIQPILQPQTLQPALQPVLRQQPLQLHNVSQGSIVGYQPVLTLERKH